MEDPQMSVGPPSSATSCSLDLHSVAVNSEPWLIAEHRTQEILCAIQPGVASEWQRKSIIDYVKWLLKHHFGAEVLPFGSVPLRTYLPDGDIDLTVLTHPNMEEDLAQNICRILKHEKNPEYPVKDTQYIQAQVKIVKCRIKNISVDLSFNQMSGLHAFNFLEQADQYIGKDHLLKRSIILIKAWCFYESRILGANHGMISTYALEILVLHILNLFHSSLPSPLAVLHRFLDYYAKFDWEGHSVTINGPIPISRLPNITVESTEEGNGLVLSQQFRGSCAECRSQEFPVKHLNIVDPLKNGNNLGRSVSRGNFHRIKGALSMGAQKLIEIVGLPEEHMVVRLDNFFKNTWCRIESGKGSNPQFPVPAFGTGRSEQRSAGDSHSWLTQHDQIVFPRHGTQLFVPLVHYHGDALPVQNDLLMLPAVQPYAQGPSAVFNLMPRPRGTGTFIPRMTCDRFRDHQSLPRTQTMSFEPQRQQVRYRTDDETKNPPELGKSGNRISANLRKKVELERGRSGDRTRANLQELEKKENVCCIDLSLDQFPQLPCVNKPIQSEKTASESEKSENVSCVDLSLDQFPHLPSINESSTSEIHGSRDPIFKSLQVKDPATVGNLKLGASRSPPLVTESLEAEMGERRTQNSAEQERQLYQLTCDDDFPPLCP